MDLLRTSRKSVLICFFASLWVLIPLRIKDDVFLKVTSLFNYNFSSCTDFYPFCFLMSGFVQLFEEVFYVRTLFFLFLSIPAFYLISKAQDIEKKVSTLTLLIVLIIFSNIFVDQGLLDLDNPVDYILFCSLIVCLYKDHYFFIPILSAFLFLIWPAYLPVIAPFLIFHLIQKQDKKFIFFSFFGLTVLFWTVFMFHSFGGEFIFIHFNESMFSYLGKLTFIPFSICFAFVLLNRESPSNKDIVIFSSGLQHLIYKIFIQIKPFF